MFREVAAAFQSEGWVSDTLGIASVAALVLLSLVLPPLI